MHLAIAPHRSFTRVLAALLVPSLVLAPLPASAQPDDSVRVFRGVVRTMVPVPSDGEAAPSRQALASVAVAEAPDDPRGPETWLATFECAYESGDSVSYAALLTTDYRFVAGDPDIESFSREAELTSYMRMIRGAISREGRPLPAARTIDVAFAEVHVMEDPSFPGNLDRALVHVIQATIAIRFSDGTSMEDTAPHAFWLVRTPGGAWQCRRWVERPAAPVLAAVDHPVVPSAGASARDVSAAGPIGVPYPNPSSEGAGIAYAYEVRGDAERVDLALFDVRGRRVATLEQATKGAGRHTARWDGRSEDGARVAAGVYFLKASVGALTSRHRLIIVR